MRRRRTVIALAACYLLVATHALGLDTHVISESNDGLRLVVEIRVPVPDRVEESIDGVAFSRFSIRGYGLEGSSGSPGLLLGTQLVAVPTGGSATLRIVDVGITDMGIVRITPRPILSAQYLDGASADDPSSAMPSEDVVYDPQQYIADGTQAEPARLGAAGALRHLSVVPIEVRPLLYDPVTGQLRIVQRLVVEVSIRRPSEAPRAGASATAQLVTPPSWLRIYDGLVPNGRSAERWLQAPEPRRPRQVALKNGMLRPGTLAEDEWKLRVRHTGPARVRAATLLQRGFPDGTPIEQLRLVLKRYDAAQPLVPQILEIPIEIEDSGDGTFRNGDAFLFYAEQPRDDATAGERAQRYTFDNVYWLSVATTGTPARMPHRARIAGALPGPSQFEQRIHYEEDSEANLWVYHDDSELYFMRRPSIVANYSLTLPGRSAGADCEVCVGTQQDWLQRPFSVYVQLPGGGDAFLVSHPGLPPVGRNGFPQPVRVCGTLAGASLPVGNLAVELRADPFPPNQPDAFDDRTPYLDNVEVRYMADYVATNNAIEFTSGGATGDVAFSISGFSTPTLGAFDVTDPKMPARFDVAGAYVNGTLMLTDAIPAGPERRYRVVPLGGILDVGSSNIVRDVRDDIAGELAQPEPGRYDVLVVAHEPFASDPALDDWKAFRVAQGHRVRVVSTSDAYDAFNGGLPHYDPIYRLVKQAYDNWGIAYVLLVGDGSEDAAGAHADSGPNFVPARVKYFPVTASAGGGSEYRNDLNDRHYAKMDADIYPDLLVGRFPVSNAQELRNVVDKTVRYETPDPSDDGRWRKRVLLFSDDEWVRRQRVYNGASGIYHQRGSSEWDFYLSVRDACTTVNNAFPGDLRCVPFHLRFMSDSLYALVDRDEERILPEHEPWPIETRFPVADDEVYRKPHRNTLSETPFYAGVSQALSDSVGSGCLFFALQSHANRQVVADEQIIRRGSPLYPDFVNHGKPFVFFGLGCHLNEFGITHEDNTAGSSSDDAIGERYVTVPERAAVASYASTGFEFLGPNASFHRDMWDVIFNKGARFRLGAGAIPRDTSEARWRILELISIAEIQSSGSGGDVIDRYCWLGDPLLQLDAGAPRFTIEQPANGFVLEGNRVGALDPDQPVRLSFTVADEQGIQAVHVERRFRNASVDTVRDVTLTPLGVDLLPEVQNKRSYRVEWDESFGSCDYDLAVVARDVLGREHEVVARASSTYILVGNGVPLNDGDRIDRRMAFRFDVRSCVPLPGIAQIMAQIDGQPVSAEVEGDSLAVTWSVGFVAELTDGLHNVRFEADGQQIAQLNLLVGGAFSLSDVIAFPNPLTDLTRVYFHLSTEIRGGLLRILDLNGRMVQKFDLRQPGVLQTERPVQAGVLGSSQFWNYVEWDGSDQTGDQVANGVYFYDLNVADVDGRVLRKRERIVVMR